MVDVADEWEAVEAQVVAMLRGRGLSSDDATDLAREALTRAMEKPIDFVSPEGLLHWTTRVAWRLSTDRWRIAQRRGQPVALDPDAFATDPDQVFDVVRHRLALDEVKRLLRGMSEPQRQALQRLAGETQQVEPTRAERLRRVRARQKLRRSVQNFPVVVFLRKCWTARSRPRLAWFASGTIAPPLVACLLMLNGLGPFGSLRDVPPAAAGRRNFTAAEIAFPATPASVGLTRAEAERGRTVEHTTRGSGQARDLDLDPRDKNVYVPRPVPGGPGGVVVETQPNGPERPIACVVLPPVPPTCIPRPGD